ncbi:DUF6318 family protein [Cellulomonas humilata]|uniref:DUF6318 domain-containing protein n=1 Tax=Cellulomonas humilata TaxID=144055 RepID=A0ABU0EFV4_9CELL|nr:DUF6318 family protein [Cellulomonas humilata]MDQ0374150.1 hypothetical protein [Cellulomonas humilata]
MAWQRRVVPALLGVVLAALVAGCTGGGPEPAATTPPPVAEVTPTPTPTPIVKPERPAAMDEPTTDGAIAAATYFMALYDYAFSARDAESLSMMSAETCKFCKYVGDSVAALVVSGHTSVGPPVRVISAVSTEIRPDEWFTARLQVAQDSTQELAADGTVVSESEANLTDFVFALSWLGDSWRVEAVDLAVIEK